MAGPAIRQLELARQLQRHFSVSLFDSGIDGDAAADVPIVRGRGLELLRLIDAHDVIVAGAVGAWGPLASATKKPVVLDLYAPRVLERLAYTWVDRSSLGQHAAQRRLMYDLDVSSAFLCASARQRDLYLGMLSAQRPVSVKEYEADPNLESLIRVVPFGVSDSAPMRTRRAIKGVVENISVDDTVLLWGGGLYEWFDARPLIDAMAVLRNTCPTLKLFFLGSDHPDLHAQGSRTAETKAAARDLGLLGRSVFFNDGWVKYEDRVNYLLDADIGVTAAPDTLENRFSFRTRVLDYLWSGLPIITTGGDVWSETIQVYACGLRLTGRSPDAWISAITDLYNGVVRRSEMAAAARALSDLYRWSRVAEPLIDLCHDMSYRGRVGKLSASVRLVELGAYSGALRAAKLSAHVRRPGTTSIQDSQ